LFKDPFIVEQYWMEKGYTSEEMEIIKVSKRARYYGVEHARSSDVERIIPSDSADKGKLIIDTLVWFADLAVLPETLKSYFKDGQCELGE
jgi:hypothetical protein